MNNSNQYHEALTYRLSLPIPAELDWRKSHILIFSNCDRTKFVKVSHPREHKVVEIKNVFNPNDAGLIFRENLSILMEAKARELWQHKYSEGFPDQIEVDTSDSGHLLCFRELAFTLLSNDEWTFIESMNSYLSWDDLWLVLLGLNWKPGMQVAEDDKKWQAVWVEDQNCGGTLDAVREYLGMSELT